MLITSVSRDFGMHLGGAYLHLRCCHLEEYICENICGKYYTSNFDFFSRFQTTASYFQVVSWNRFGQDSQVVL